MATSRVVAAAETYIGLIEFGVGLVPAGGGCKEMLRRVVSPPMQTQEAQALPFLQQAFEQIAEQGADRQALAGQPQHVGGAGIARATGARIGYARQATE